LGFDQEELVDEVPVVSRHQFIHPPVKHTIQLGTSVASRSKQNRESRQFIVSPDELFDRYVHDVGKIFLMLRRSLHHLDQALLSECIVAFHSEMIADDLHLPPTAPRQVVAFKIQLRVAQAELVSNVGDDQRWDVLQRDKVAQPLKGLHQH
jgi:hypothetical protein